MSSLIVGGLWALCGIGFAQVAVYVEVLQGKQPDATRRCGYAALGAVTGPIIPILAGALAVGGSVVVFTVAGLTSLLKTRS